MRTSFTRANFQGALDLVLKNDTHQLMGRTISCTGTESVGSGDHERLEDGASDMPTCKILALQDMTLGGWFRLTQAFWQ
jgi:hypothetical protein